MYGKKQARAIRESLQASLVQILREYSEALLIAVILAVLLRFFVISVYRIPTSSMYPNLQVGDFILVYKIPYSFSLLSSRATANRVPERGSVMVFRCPQNTSVSCVKRVIALPGDRVQIIKKRLFVNGQAASYSKGREDSLKDLPGRQYYAVVNEKILDHQRALLIGEVETNQNFGPVVVPPGHVFVLGDNRDSSDDSRFWGAVPLRNLEGRVLFVWLSLDWRHPVAGGYLPHLRWGRLFDWVD